MFTQTPLHEVSPVGHAHLPATQLVPTAQVLPHAPQFAPSVCSLTHALPHWERPAPHWAGHCPAEQTAPAAHAVPHAPQLAGLELVFVHTPLQEVWPAGHAHAPATQAIPPVHCRPQPAQLVASVCSLTQAFPHSESPVPHWIWHCPLEQTVPAAHELPQPPQLVALELVLVQTPPQKV
jgi:hypothetical protein